MPIDFGKLTDKIVKRVLDNLEGSNPDIQNAGEQVGESFVDGIEHGLDDAASRIAASSLKINKAFKDLAKKITNQNISLSGISIDFSDIDIDSADFQKRINEVFEKFKIDNAIEFDSSATEKQFKDMLALHTKYAAKLSRLQDQKPKLTSQASIKANAQAQLAIVDGLKEIQRILDQTSGMSIELPHVYLGDVKELRTSVSLIEQMEKGEEKVGKQRDTNAEKIRKEKKELKEKVDILEQEKKLLEEKVGAIEDGELPPVRKPRARKSKEPSESDVARQRGEEMKVFVAQFEDLQKELGDTSKWFGKFNDFLNQIQQGSLTAADAVAKLREEAAARAAEEARLAKEQEDAERRALELAQQRAAEEARIGSSGTQKEIKSQEELQKEIEDTNRVIKIQKQRLEYLDPVLDDENFKTSGKREATEQLRSKTSNLVDVRRHPEQYEHLEMYAEKAEVAWAKAYKEAERQGVAQSTLNRYYTDAGYAYDENIKKLQEERAWHAKILEDEENKLAVLQQQMQAETSIEKVRKHSFSRTINGKSGKFNVKKPSYETDSGQMSMLPAVEAETNAKNKLADANEKVAKSQKKIKEEVQGTQTTMFPSDDLIDMTPDEADEWLNGPDEVGKSAEEATPKVEEEARAIDKVGKAAEKAAESKKKFAKANKEVVAKGSATFDENGEGGKNVWTTSRSGESLDTLNLPVRYEGENGQDAVQMFAGLKSQIEEMTGKPVTIDFSSNVNEDGKLEAIGATLKYVNEEAGVTVKQFYNIERGEGDMLVATQSYEKATLSATKAAKNFNAEMQRKVADAQIKTLETQMGELELDLTDVKQAAADINDQASLDKFNLELKAAKEEAKQLKAELKGQNALDTIASMERSSLALPSELERIKRKLEELGHVEGVEAIDDVLRSVEEEYHKFLTTDKSKDKTKAFRSLSTSMTWIKAEMQNLADLNSKQKKQETQVEKEKLSKQKAARESYINLWKTTLHAQSEEEAAAQKRVNEAYREYIRLVQERGKKEKELVGLDPEKNQEQINRITTRINEVDEKLNTTYGDLLSNKIAQATLTLEDFMKYYDKWQREIADKEAKEADKARNKEEKPYRDYGKTTANSAVRKRDNLQGEIDALGVTNPEILAKIDTYKAKVQEVVDLRDKFANDPAAAKDPALVKNFQKASVEAERTRRGIKAVIDEEQKMKQMSAEQGFDTVELSADQIANLKNEMIAHARATAQGRVELKGWDGDNKKLYYTVTDSKGAVQEMTLALGQGTNTMYQLRTATKETGTLIQQIFKGIKVKAKELLSFVIGGGSVYKVIELLRQGIQYVREIDLALTELKKVTDETEETYDRFLETAAKTADKVGSTIQKVVSSTADWARLGSILANTNIRPII